MVKTKCERITEEFAQQYISLKEDFSGIGVHECPYFTKTQSNDGWDLITYYTYRKRSQFINRGEDYKSWVYILSNSAMPGLLKIGYTDRENPEQRAKEISQATGVPQPFKLEWAFNCHDGRNLESEVHNRLSSHRSNRNKEFFEIDLLDAQFVIEGLGKNYL